MDQFRQNNPNLLPRKQVRLEHVTEVPYPKGSRVKVDVAITPFQERPNLEITIRDPDGKRVAHSSAIAIMNFRIMFTLHLRGVERFAGVYVVQVTLSYEEVQDTCEIAFHIPERT